MKDEKQRGAYLCGDPCVVYAGPGSGKTATLTLKIMRLLNEEIKPPRGLACVTFNNEAVREYKNRLRLLGLPHRPNIFLGTIHSFCLSCVIRPFAKIFRPDLPFPLRVASEDIQFGYLQKAMDKIGIRRQPYEFRASFDRYRRTHLDRDAKGWQNDEELAEAIETYESLLHTRNYVDFDDLILIALNLIEKQSYIRHCLSARYPWLVIDEYQDLGYPLHRIVVSLLASGSVKVFAVGDPDQSIYGFTGANPKYLQELADREGVIPIRLGLNYRSGQKIIDGAGVILAPDLPRNYRSSKGTADPGEIYFYMRPGGLEDQAALLARDILPKLINAGYKPKEIAVLYIDRNDAVVLIKVLEEWGIPYAGERDQRYRRTPVTRWIEDMAQWSCGVRGKEGVLFSEICDFWIGLLKNAGQKLNENNDLRLRQDFFSILIAIQNLEMFAHQWLLELDERLCLQKQLKQSAKTSPDELDAFNSMASALSEEGPLGAYNLADLAGCGANAERICLTTLHSSKGRQFDVVIIPGLEEGRLPSYSATSDEALREARRTFYVGFTRARKLVNLLYSGWYQFRQYTFRKGPSRFVLELQEALERQK
jgi:DNA helicase-2/ATP-dependent DNA helicase PcrA